MKIMVGTPAYGGSVTTNYMNSYVNAVKMLPAHIELVLHTYPGDSLITRARNTMAAQFMASDCDALLFIDADIGFDPQHIERLVDSGKDVVGGIYPLKEILWERVIDAVHENPEAKGYDDVGMHSVNLVTNGVGKPNPDGYAPVYEIGTGFMLIQRSVFEKLQARYPDLWYTTDMRGRENFDVWNFFDAFVVTLDGQREDGTPVKIKRYLSEDYGFCALWREAGGEIWADVTSNILTHQGTYTYGKP